MTEESTSNKAPPDEVERQFQKDLLAAAYVFETEKNGRFNGLILACKAVAQFIYDRGGAAELAGPFLQIVAAFKELERGGKPSLFLPKTAPEKKRARSPERKHAQMLAAAALEVLVKLGDERSVAAKMVARQVGKWPVMGMQMVEPLTVIAWRKQYRKLTGERRNSFDKVTQVMLAESDPRTTVNDLLKKGPPGHWAR